MELRSDDPGTPMVPQALGSGRAAPGPGPVPTTNIAAAKPTGWPQHSTPACKAGLLAEWGGIYSQQEMLRLSLNSPPFPHQVE